jgi:hypothetical protein
MREQKHEWATTVVREREVAEKLEHYTNNPDGRGVWTFWPPIVWAGTIRGEALFLLTFNRYVTNAAPRRATQEGEG